MPHAVKRAPTGGGRGNQGRGKGGRGGRGGGGGRGNVASRGQQTKDAAEAKAKQQEEAKNRAKQYAQNRLNQLERHLQLNCFSYLDEQSRKNIFMVMGWPMDNYMRRKEQMRMQMTNVKAMKEKRLKEEEEKASKAAEEGYDGEPVDNSDLIEGLKKDIAELTAILTKANADRQRNIKNVIKMKEERLKAEENDPFPKANVIEAMKKEITHLNSLLDPQPAKEKADVVEEDVKPKKLDMKEFTAQATLEGMEKAKEVITNGGTQEEAKEAAKAYVLAAVEKWQKEEGESGEKEEAATATDDTEEEGKDEKEEEVEKLEGQVKAISIVDNLEGEENEASDEKQGDDDKEDKPKEEKVEPVKEILPPLMERTDPDTLLDRLNTRRLFARILDFKRKQRKKVAKLIEEEGETGEVKEEEQGEDELDPMRGIAHMFDKELEGYSQEEKDNATANRIYPKNMSVSEIAEKEWDELLKVAKLRNTKQPIPWDPIPTQYELLQFSPCPRAVGVLATYPRSGNSLMRTMYEHTALRVTGSDMQGGLAKHDLVGEMAVGANMVQFVKTHFPERMGTPPFKASRAVLLVRNPFDAMESFFNLMMTGTHTNSLSEEVREKTKKVFEEYVMKEIRVWKAFHEFWLNQDIPILFIRYEDLIRNPPAVMMRVIQFTLEIKRMNTFFEERVYRCCSERAEIERMGSYKPRSGGIGKSVMSGKYSPELFQKLKDDEDLRELMDHFGYGDIFSKPPEEWVNMKPLEDHGIEYLPSWHQSGQQKVVILNRGNLARTRNENTPWQKIKMEMGIVENKCDCEHCRAKKKEAAKGSRFGDENDADEGEVKTCLPVTEEKEQEAKTTETDLVGEKVQTPSPTNKENAGYAN